MSDSSAEGPIAVPVKLDKGTLVPISIAFSIIVSFLAAWGWLNSQFAGLKTSIDASIKVTDERFATYERRMERVETKAANSWTIVDETLWVSEFRRMNPAMSIPETRRN